MEYSQQQLIYRKKLINISENLNNAQNVITALLSDDVYDDEHVHYLNEIISACGNVANTLYEENQQCK
jgi:hypothetical protein